MKISQNPNSYIFDNIRYGYNASETFTLIWRENISLIIRDEIFIASSIYDFEFNKQ